ncbi:MAG: molybdate ABC transporter permease subunit [Lachnospiraceae bacterium]|nr:molybdate ABC transporter permease subunit [Lachnospiraceae bacterium]MDY5741767.1 molybdate ABC transporter permease subunit [Lachnospiraceae bacterium]
MEWSPILVSLKTALIAMAVTFLLGLWAAVRVHRMNNERLQQLIDSLLLLPLVLPPTVMGFLLLQVFGVRGPVGAFFLQFFQTKLVFSWISTVIASVVIAFPLMYRSARAAFDQVDPRLCEAARTLGMPERHIIRRILLPAARPGLLSGGVLAFARGFGEYGATSMLAGNILGKTRTLPLAVASEVAAGQQDRAAVYVLIMLGISMILLLAMHRIGRSRVSGEEFRC